MREDGAYIEAGENDNLIVQKLESNTNALGIFGYSFLDQNADKVQGSKVDGVEPTFESIADGNYPVSRPLYFYVKKAHVGVIPGIKQFIAEFTSDKAWGPEGYLADKGLIPCPMPNAPVSPSPPGAGAHVQARTSADRLPTRGRDAPRRCRGPRVVHGCQRIAPSGISMYAWILILMLLALMAVAYQLGRQARRLLAWRAFADQHAPLAACLLRPAMLRFGRGIPALLLMGLWAGFQDQIVTGLVTANLSADMLDGQSAGRDRSDAQRHQEPGDRQHRVGDRDPGSPGCRRSICPVANASPPGPCGWPCWPWRLAAWPMRGAEPAPRCAPAIGSNPSFW